MVVTNTREIITSQLTKYELESISESLLIKSKSDPNLFKSAIEECIKNNPTLIHNEIDLKNKIDEEFTITHKRIITLGFGLATIAIFTTFEMPYNIFASIPFIIMGIFSGFKSIKK